MERGEEELLGAVDDFHNFLSAVAMVDVKVNDRNFLDVAAVVQGVKSPNCNRVEDAESARCRVCDMTAVALGTDC